MSISKAKYIQIEEYLRNNIDSGTWKSGEKIPTIRQLIADLKTSDSTVLRAINVLAKEGLIIKRQGSGTYVSDKNNIKMPEAGKTFRFGVLWCHSVNPEEFKIKQQGEMTRGILSGLEIKENPLWHQNQPHQETHATWKTKDHRFIVDALGEAEPYLQYHPPLRAIQDIHFDGLITLGIYHQKWLTDLLSLNIPTVIGDFPNEEFHHLADHVLIDPEVGYKQATRKFLEQGCKNIHFIGELIPGEISDKYKLSKDVVSNLKGSFKINPDSALRQFAVEQMLANYGRSLSDEQKHFVPYGKNGIDEVIKNLINLPNRKKPDAIICHNQNDVQKILSAFKEIKIPLRGIGASSNFSKSEDVIYADLKEFGKIAIELLVSKLSQPNRSPLSVGVPMKFINTEIQHLNPAC